METKYFILYAQGIDYSEIEALAEKQDFEELARLYYVYDIKLFTLDFESVSHESAMEAAFGWESMVEVSGETFRSIKQAYEMRY